MLKRMALFPLLLLVSLPLAAAASSRAPKAKPQALPAITVDTHEDTPSAYMRKPFDLGSWNKEGMVDYARMKAGKLDAAFFAAYVPPRVAGKGAAAYCLRIMETIHEMVERYPADVKFAASTADIRSTVAGGKRAILIGVEGGHAIEDSLDVLRAFYRLGARYMTLTHNNTNDWADSSGDEEKNHGLTPFGRDVVREMNRLGMMVDVSHVSDKTFYDVIETSKAPVIASHSSARALCGHARNMTDDMLRALSKNGGVVMVNFLPSFLSDEVRLAAVEREKKLAPRIEELKAKYPEHSDEYETAVDALQAADPLPTIPYTRIVDHIDHMVKVAGIDHVGIGSDFDGISSTPVGMEDVSKLPAIPAELKRRGYSDADIRKIMGGNFMRVFAEVEKAAAAAPK